MTPDHKLADEIERAVALAGHHSGRLGSLIRPLLPGILAALRRSPEPGIGWFLGMRVIVNPAVPNDEMWISASNGQRVIVTNLAASEQTKGE